MKKTIALRIGLLLLALLFAFGMKLRGLPDPLLPGTGKHETRQVGTGSAVVHSQDVGDSSVDDSVPPDARAKMDRLNSIFERMKGKHYNTKPVLQELVQRLKESPDGKLSREEVRRILPRDMAQDYEEFLSVIQSEPGGGRL